MIKKITLWFFGISGVVFVLFLLLGVTSAPFYMHYNWGIGTNTRSQVLGLAEYFPELLATNIVVVTSPEHLKRTIKCFNKVGFEKVRSIAAHESHVDFCLSLQNQKLKGKESIPHVENTMLRYTFWNYLKLEIDTCREYFALFYYKIKGWI